MLPYESNLRRQGEKEESERLRNVDLDRHKPHNFQLT